MSHVLIYRSHRFAGVRALFDLTTARAFSDTGSPVLPTAPRLRQDIGLPELEAEPPIFSVFGQRI